MCHRRRQRAIAYQGLTLLDTILEQISEEFYIFYKKNMFLFSVFSMLGLFVFLVLFTASGNLKIQPKPAGSFKIKVSRKLRKI